MSQSATENNHIMVAVMGATGAGKSAFIRHLTNDPKIIVSHSIHSEMSEIQTSCYMDAKTGRSVMLIDTPGFDNPRECITDTDILRRIIDFLNPKKGEGKKLNGIIYMHRITDNRLGGMAAKNFNLFKALCGEQSFRHVCIVTTHWDDDDHGMGPARENEMREGPLKSLLSFGAQMCRHSNTAQSAQAIMAGLIPLSGVTTQIQEEVTSGIPLGETRAGRILDEYIEELKKKHQSATENHVMVAVMGATGTGKSAFIRHLTNDPKIIVGNSINSETSEIQTSCYVDAKTGRSITLIDTPGFDDSRERVTDTDILQKIIDFLNPEEGEGKKLNGIIYMHRIIDNRMGGMARKNFRMFQALCGEQNFRHVRVVTTHWDHDYGMGPVWESEMKEGPLKSLLASGAQMCRHSNTAQSAQAIMAGLIPLSEVTTQIQEEVTRDIPLGETRAGYILDEYIEVLRKKYQEELANLGRELKQAVQDQELTAELKAEGKMLGEKLMRTEEDQNDWR